MIFKNAKTFIESIFILMMLIIVTPLAYLESIILKDEQLKNEILKETPELFKATLKRMRNK